MHYLVRHTKDGHTNLSKTHNDTTYTHVYASHLALDEIIIPVDLQHVATVACDGAPGAVEEATVTAHLGVSYRGLLAVDGLTGIMYTTGEG